MAEFRKSIEQIRSALSADAHIARYVPKRGLSGQVEKVLIEMTGEGFPAEVRPGGEARLWHARHHGLSVA